MRKNQKPKGLCPPEVTEGASDRTGRRNQEFGCPIEPLWFLLHPVSANLLRQKRTLITHYMPSVHNAISPGYHGKS